MRPRPAAFRPSPGTRRRQLEYTPYIDASELAWSGALFGQASRAEWPWSKWAEREQDLARRGWIQQALALRHYIVSVESPTHVRLRGWFTPMGPGVRLDGPLTLRHTLFLEATPCRFGGQQWWFICYECKRRRKRLYRTMVRPWECRVCLGLTYRSRQEHNTKSRHGSRFRRLRRMLDLEEAALDRASRRRTRRAVARIRASVGRMDLAGNAAAGGRTAQRGDLSHVPTQQATGRGSRA